MAKLVSTGFILGQQVPHSPSQKFCTETFSNLGEFIYEAGILVRRFPLTLSGDDSQSCAIHSFQKFHSMGNFSHKFFTKPCSHGFVVESAHPWKGVLSALHLIVVTWENRGSILLRKALEIHITCICPHAVSEQRLHREGLVWCQCTQWYT